ncbi:MAG TPA: hypothetical protein VJ183_11585 [Chloroflexia bacterium]|nr:hypothetical protein [Chloroflexia bacterium]
MNKRIVLFATMVMLMALVSACDSGPAPQPTSQPRQPTLPAQTTQTIGTPTVVDAAPITPPPTPVDDFPSPTPVTITSTGEPLTALQALAALKPKALAWQSDVRLAMLANVRPGQQKLLLGVALGDPDVFEPTPGGTGRNWTLVAVSPSRGGVAISMDGTEVDLVAEGSVTGEMLGSFSDPRLSPLDLATLDAGHLIDSDKIDASAGNSAIKSIGIALIAPAPLGVGPLPTPQSGGAPPTLAYEAFSADPAQQAFVIFNAVTGEVVLDSAKP